MWLLKDTPGLFTDLYELTMAQAYFRQGMNETGYFEAFVRHLPPHWGFFVMAGLREVESYLREFRFAPQDIEYLRSTGIFAEDFLEYLSRFQLEVRLRALPEGTVFFPNEPIMEVGGPILHAQLLETYLLNILGFSIIEATLAARMVSTARGIPVVDFGLRRCQGPISSLRAARGGQIAGFAGTSNVYAARLLGMPPSGTMAHSFIEAHSSEEQAFRAYAEMYGARAILLVDTYNSIEGIKTAARVAKDFLGQGIRIRGIRLDSGDLVELSKFARAYFQNKGLEFLRIFVSGDLDEFRIAELLEAGAEIDGFGVGTRFTVSQHVPAIGIVYKISQYGARRLHKTSPEKQTHPGRKTILRTGSERYEKDTIGPFDPDAKDLLQPFESAEPMPMIQQRLAHELSHLPDPVKALRNPASYLVEWAEA
ncbi:MAG: nicotinate phosphoribosyltransferase [Planctomycetes bacterium]|nr:nicotinate phosphoribosyltransferase [Planctomycetota bacterium]